MLKLRRLSRNEIGRLGDFLRTHYGEAHYGADAAYMRWLYLDSPCDWFAEEVARGVAPVNVLVDADDAVAAVHAFVPFDAHTPWGGGRGIWDLEWINGSGVRGAGRRLAEALLAEADIYVGFGCNELSETAFGNLGMAVVPEIHRAVVVLAPTALAAELAVLGETPVLPAAAHCDARWSRLDRAGTISAEALDAYVARTPFGVGRSRQWLDWRYDRHPYLRYDILTARQHGGGAVLRVETVPGRQLQVCRLLEFLPTDRDDAAALAAAVVSYAITRECLFLDYFSSSDSHVRQFEDALATIGLPSLRNPRIPYMTQPLQYGPRNSINMVIAAGGAGGDAARHVDLGQFHSGKGDANQDVLRRR